MDKLLIRPLIAVLISLLIPARFYRRKSLDPSGAIAGVAVMTIHIAVGYIQVLSNSGIASILVLVLWAKSGLQEKWLDSDDSFLVRSLVGGFIGHYACSNGNTWSSELGVLCLDCLRLSSLFRRVPMAELQKQDYRQLQALCIGLTFVVFGFLTTKCAYDVALKQLLVIPISTLAGLGGSVIDSLLGATLQFSGFCTVRNKVVGQKLRKSQVLTFLTTML